MPLSLTLACLWALVASLIAFLPSKRNHWPQAVVLIAVGIPLLGYVTYENGPMAGVICLIAGGSILRWPIAYAFRWMRGKGRPTPSASQSAGGDDASAPARSPE